jgi:hypothetical protein
MLTFGGLKVTLDVLHRLMEAMLLWKADTLSALLRKIIQKLNVTVISLLDIIMLLVAYGDAI